jgi:hypothetical protein
MTILGTWNRRVSVILLAAGFARSTAGHCQAASPGDPNPLVGPWTVTLQVPGGLAGNRADVELHFSFADTVFTVSSEFIWTMWTLINCLLATRVRLGKVGLSLA